MRRPKGRGRKPTWTHTTVRVCGYPVSERYNVICTLPPTSVLKHTTHGGIAATDTEIYLITRTPEGKVYIQGGNQWEEVPDGETDDKA